MAVICANKKCAYHTKLPEGVAREPYVRTIEDGEVITVTRHLYSTRDGRREYFLCDVCNAAVQMVMRHNVEFSGGAPLHGAASAGTQGSASDGPENGGANE